MVSVEELERHGMHVVPMDRDGKAPRDGERVDTKGWLRPRLLGHKAVIPVAPAGHGLWHTLWGKRKNNGDKKKGAFPILIDGNQG
jgi:hypothetical protein